MENGKNNPEKNRRKYLTFVRLLQFDPQTRQEQSKEQKHWSNPPMNRDKILKNNLMTPNPLVHVTIQDVFQECTHGSMLENLMIGLPTEQVKGRKANGQHSCIY